MILSFLSDLLGKRRTNKARDAVVPSKGERRKREKRREPPMDVNLDTAVYVPLPPSPASWEANEGSEESEEFSDEELRAVFEAHERGHHQKTVKLAAEVPKEALDGRLGEIVAESYRKLFSARRRAGQLSAAAKVALEMLERVPRWVKDEDKRRYNKAVRTLRKAGKRTAFELLGVDPPAKSPLFEVEDASGWSIENVRKLSQHEKPDPAFRKIHFTADGLLLVDPTGRSEVAAGGPAALRKLDWNGNPVSEIALSHDIYRSGIDVSNTYIALMDSDGKLHILDSRLKPVLCVPLANDRRVAEHFRTTETNYWGEFRTQVRTVDVSPDGTSYLFTLADEAWCCSMDGSTRWGIRMPLNEGWERVVQRSQAPAVGHNVNEALRELGLCLPLNPFNIKKRYWGLAREHHPDRNPGNPHAHERMQRINEAFSVLTGIDPTSFEVADEFVTSFRRNEPDHVIEAGGLRLEVTYSMGTPQDWIYGAAFSVDGSKAYLATYSGKVVRITRNGEAERVYDLGSIANEIVDTGTHLYLKTDTRLYVLRNGIELTMLLDIYDQGQLVISDRGFGLLEAKRLRWFAPEGNEVGAVTSKDPIRLLMGCSDGLRIQTRQHEATVNGLYLG